jgi:predicted acetyltransferase
MVSYALPHQVSAIKKLWKEVFHDSDLFLDAFFTNIFKPNQCLVSTENDELCAAMQLLPYAYCDKGKTYKAVYIYAVMTKPEKRKAGHMAALFQVAFEELHKQQIELVFLIPQTEGLREMYSKFGFKSAFTQARKTLQLPLFNQQAILPTTHDAYAFYLEVMSLHKTVVQTYKQFEFVYKSILQEGGELLAMQNNATVEAICFVLPYQNTVRVLDVVALNQPAFERMLGAVSTKYNVSEAIVSSYLLPENNYIGMAQLLQPTNLQFKFVQTAYLSLMLNE